MPKNRGERPPAMSRGDEIYREQRGSTHPPAFGIAPASPPGDGNELRLASEAGRVSGQNAGERAGVQFVQRQAHDGDGHAGASPNRTASSFGARFGRVILSHGIAVIPTALYHFQGKLDLSAQLVWFISNILSHKWDDDLPYPSLNKMARCGGVDKTQLYDYKDRLCGQGYLRVYSRQDERGRRDTNAYDFSPLFGRLEALIAESAPRPNAIRGQGEEAEQFSAELADSSFVARYGRVITRYGITAVPRAVFTHGAQLGLSLQQVWFISYIFSYRWDTPLPYPSIKRMSANTGYSTVQLHNIKAELVRAGYLRLVSRYTSDGGQDSNAYDFSGLLDAVNMLLKDATAEAPTEEPETAPQAPEVRAPRRGRKPPSSGSEGAKARLHKSQEDRVERAGGDGFTGAGGENLTPVGSVQLPAYSGDSLPGPGGGQLSGYDGGYFTRDGGGGLPRVGGGGLAERGNAAPSADVVPALQGKVVKPSHEIESTKIESYKRDDSNRLPPEKSGSPGEHRPLIPGYSRYVANVADDISRELGDTAHRVSNMKQALNLWQGSGLEDEQFVKVMQEARRLTRKNQGRPTWDPLNNKMAYYFAILRDLLTRQDTRDGQSPRSTYGPGPDSIEE